MSIARGVRLTVAFVAATVTYAVLPVHSVVAAFASFLVMTYLTWVAFVATRKQQDHLLDGEKTLDTTEQHGMVTVFAALMSLPGLAALGVSVWLWWRNLGIPVDVPRMLRRFIRRLQLGAGRDRDDLFIVPRHFEIPVWWLPVLLVTVPCFLAALYLWQNKKHTRYVTTSRRFFKQRTFVRYMPWLRPVFDETPYEQFVQVDEKSSTIGNWGDLRITVRLHPGSDNVDQVIVHKLIPQSQTRVNILRAAHEEFKEEIKKKAAGNPDDHPVAQAINKGFRDLTQRLDRRSPAVSTVDDETLG